MRKMRTMMTMMMMTMTMVMTTKMSFKIAMVQCFITQMVIYVLIMMSVPMDLIKISPTLAAMERNILEIMIVALISTTVQMITLLNVTVKNSVQTMTIVLMKLLFLMPWGIFVLISTIARKALHLIFSTNSVPFIGLQCVGETRVQLTYQILAIIIGTKSKRLIGWALLVSTYYNKFNFKLHIEWANFNNPLTLAYY